MTPAERAELRELLTFECDVAARGCRTTQAIFDAAFVEMVGHSLCDVGALGELILMSMDIS
jgi:hypothetical protein